MELRIILNIIGLVVVYICYQCDIREMCYVDTYGNSREQTAINYISARIRPIVTLNTGIQITLGDGTQETPYEL